MPPRRDPNCAPTQLFKFMLLDREEIFEVVKANTLKVLPDLLADDVTIDKNLTDLGANSVDRVEVVIYSLEELGLKVPTAELHGVRNLRALVDLLHRHALSR
jgi:polyketide biosynthesis acyl carrier protein